MYAIYSALLALALLVAAPWFLVQMGRHGKYRAGLRERLGFIPQRLRVRTGPTIWVHAVSVGEVLAVSALVQRLRAESGRRVVVSTTTQTGQKLASDRFGWENVFFFPLDFTACIRPYLDVLRPEMVILAETEFWPNFLHAAKTSGAKVAVVNARISDRSYPRYRRLRGVLARVLENVDLFLAQSDEDARRLTGIGARGVRVFSGGNLKFDVKPPEPDWFIREFAERLDASPSGPVIVAGSTVEGEEPLVLDAFKILQRDYPGALLVLAPRHKERFDAVAEQMREAGVSFTRRSLLDQAEALPTTGVMLLDTIGELAAMYSVADIAFVGGSLVPRGGHNILEPAYFGIATLVGPYTENFRDIINTFNRDNAVVITQPEQFAASLLQLVVNEDERRALGARARKVLEQQTGATERTMTALQKLIEGRK